MGFQLAYGESTVLQTALFIAVREWESRLANPAMEAFHAETRAQIDIANHMRERLTPGITSREV